MRQTTREGCSWVWNDLFFLLGKYKRKIANRLWRSLGLLQNPPVSVTGDQHIWRWDWFYGSSPRSVVTPPGILVRENCWPEGHSACGAWCPVVLLAVLWRHVPINEARARVPLLADRRASSSRWSTASSLPFQYNLQGYTGSDSGSCLVE